MGLTTSRFAVSSMHPATKQEVWAIKKFTFTLSAKDELCFHTKNEACRLLRYLIVLVDVYSLGSVEVSCSEVLDSVVCWDPLLAIVCSQHVGLSYKRCEILGWEKGSGVSTRSTSAFDRNSTIFGGQDACHFNRTTYTTTLPINCCWFHLA